MKSLQLSSISLIALLIAAPAFAQKLTYPTAKKVDQIDDYHGVKVADPYRWLEDDRSDETGLWVKEQNEVTQSYLEQIPFRDEIKERLTEIWNYPKTGAPFKAGPYYFFYKNSGVQNQSVLYYQKGIDAEPEVLLDPNKLSEDGTAALSSFVVSKDGTKAVYGVSIAGSDWTEFHVMDLASKEKLHDHLKWIKFSSASWAGDGFYYSRYDAPKKGKEFTTKNEYHKVYYHKIGDIQDQDKLIYQDTEHPLRNFYADVTEDENFLIIYGSEGTSGSSLYYRDLRVSDNDFRVIDEGFKYTYNVIDHSDGRFLIKTNRQAPRMRLVTVDLQNTDTTNWEDVIPEAKEVLSGITLAGGQIIAQYIRDAISVAYVYEMNGEKSGEIELAGLGTMSGLSGKKTDSLAFYQFGSFTDPGTVYKYNMNSGESTVHTTTKTSFDLSDYETIQTFYPSKDGTEIPMFIVHKKGLVQDGKNPTLLYGYGGFDISIMPRFSLFNTIFLENGGVYVVANIRGGGEYGEKWHNAGTKLNKQNVFDDFIAAAEYLITTNYTNSSKLAISGRSNGGLLVGACMTQRPELFKVAFPAVGVMDMLRFHNFTIGWAWTGDYGSSDNPDEFRYLLGYSPLHNLKKGTSYPATMVTTADHDDRVVPAHSFKFLATLQEMHGGDTPVLGRIEVDAGHGAGKPVSKRIEENTDLLSFLFYNLEMTPALK
ncbi:MAG: S9 family peptidase [Flavobacteriales bacterium]|nr:S9 family peptidase [Flavobacteriales bacterium]